MQHLALKVRDHNEMMAMRDRLRSKGVPVLGPLDHGMCVSMYFAGPENLSLELSYLTWSRSTKSSGSTQKWWRWRVFLPRNWLDTKNPAAFDGSGGKVTQPAIDDASTGPHMTNYPPGHYEATMGIPDDIALTMVESEPPVPA